MLRAKTFIFSSYVVDAASSTITFTYRVEFQSGRVRTYTDRLMFPDVAVELWEKVPKEVLESTLQALLIMIGINYWCVFPTKNIQIEGFTLRRAGTILGFAVPKWAGGILLRHANGFPRSDRFSV